MGKNTCYIGKKTLFENENKVIVSSMKKSFWTVDDLMEQTGLARQTIYNKCSRGEILYRKRWGKLYFVPDEIINMIEEGEIDGKNQ